MTTMLAEVVINDALFAAAAALVTAAILGLVGWVLTQAVTLGRITSRLEERTEDHERRITTLEAVRKRESM